MKMEYWGQRENMNFVLPVAALAVSIALVGDAAHAQDLIPAIASDHTISGVFDHKIWPLIMDVGKPLTKTMMAMGGYKIIRNDVTSGWQMIYRAGLGLLALYAIGGVVDILEGVGRGLESI